MATRTRTRISLILAALLATAAVVTVREHTSGRPAPGSTAKAERAARYTLALRGEQTLHLPASQGGVLKTALALEGQLTVAEGGGGRRLLLLEDLRVRDARLGDHPLGGLEAEARKLQGRVVVARYDASGRYDGLDLPEGVPESMQGLFHQIAATLQRPATPTAHLVEDATPLGIVDAEYTLDAETLRRVRGAFGEPHVPFNDTPVMLDAEGGTRFEFDTEGELASLEHDERTIGRGPAEEVLVDDHLALTLTRQSGAASLPAVGRTRPAGVGVIVADTDGGREFVRQAAGGLTPEALIETLRTHADAVEVPNHSRFLFQAVHLLRLEPEAARRLAAVFAAMRPGAPGRGLVLDLLAQVGTDASQETMVEILRAPAATGDAEFPYHLQRMGFAEDPGPALVDFARELAEAPPAGLENQARHALGAVAGHLYAVDPVAGAELAQPLLEALEDCEDTQARVGALRALGNAGVPRHIEAVAEYAADGSPQVRRAAAAALRKMNTATSRALLGDLANDPDPTVAMEALRDLADATPDAELWGALDQLAGTPTLDEHLSEVLTNLLALHLADPGARAVMERLAARADLSSRLAARLRVLRG